MIVNFLVLLESVLPWAIVILLINSIIEIIILCIIPKRIREKWKQKVYTKIYEYAKRKRDNNKTNKERTTKLN